MWHYGMGWGFFPFFPLLPILFWLGIAFLFFGRFGRRPYHQWHQESEKSAEEILANRYARGEIKKEEFEERMEVLKKHK